MKNRNEKITTDNDQKKPKAIIIKDHISTLHLNRLDSNNVFIV